MNSPVYRPWVIVGVSAVLIGFLGGLLVRNSSVKPVSAKPKALVVFCAAGIRTPVEKIAWQYEQEHGVPIQLNFGGSLTLLASISVAKCGDLYLPGDEDYLALAREKGLVAETLPVAGMSAVLAVRKGNPRGLRSLEDLLREKVAVAQANPEATAIGKLTREALERSGHWSALKQRTIVFKPTVNDVANDLHLGTVDAGIVWDITARQYPELETVPDPLLNDVQAKVGVGILRSSDQPTAALRFARYLGARDKGQMEFARQGYTLVDGDLWTATPEFVLYSGAMNRVAIEETIQRFEQREGVRITRVYNGCGILVAQMKAGGRPDAYLTCDKSFVPPVADLFPEPPVEISDAEIVILVRQGNPQAVQTLADLAKPGLRLGVAHPEQSTLGALTRRLLERNGILDRVMTNVATQTPTATAPALLFNP